MSSSSSSPSSLFARRALPPALAFAFVSVAAGCGSEKGDAAPRGTAKGPLEATRDYVDKSKRIEAELQLHALGKHLKIAYAENDTLPAGSAPLTPATPCCAGPDHKCPVDPAQWNSHPVWAELDVAMEDPHYFQYSYEARSPTTARATAVGDLDCDGTTITYVLDATVGDSGVETVLSKPTNAD